MIIFDTETTGLPAPEASPLSKQPQIIEFAAVKLDNELNEVGSIEFLCNPGKPLSEKIIEITGLKDEDLKDKPPFGFYYNQLCEFFLGEKTIVAHNLTFDTDLLKFELMRLGKQYQFPWPYKRICTVESTQHIRGYRLNMAKLHEMAGLGEIKDAHRAMNDVRALVNCVRWLIKEGKLND